MTTQDLQRQRALELAVDTAGQNDGPGAIVAAAQTFLTFLTSTTAAIEPATRSKKPLAAKVEPEAPRLDDPVVVAEAEKLIESPIVAESGRHVEIDTTPAVVENPTLTAGASTSAEPSSAPAASVSSSASASAPAAGESIDATKVNAAVLAVNAALGREVAVKLLADHGGKRVPEVPVENHRALFDAANALLPEDKRISL